MRIQHQTGLTQVTGIKELGASNAETFKDEFREAFPESVKEIEIDLSQTTFLDSCGLGALIAIYKTACSRNGSVILRLVNPTPPVQQLFELTRLHRLFEIVRR
jgi:anti-sigma B factor antagonist